MATVEVNREQAAEGDKLEVGMSLLELLSLCGVGWGGVGWGGVGWGGVGWGGVGWGGVGWGGMGWGDCASKWLKH